MNQVVVLVMHPENMGPGNLCIPTPNCQECTKQIFNVMMVKCFGKAVEYIKVGTG